MKLYEFVIYQNSLEEGKIKKAIQTAGLLACLGGAASCGSTASKAAKHGADGAAKFMKGSPTELFMKKSVMTHGSPWEKSDFITKNTHLFKK